MKLEVDFFQVVMVGADGSRRPVTIGFADNGTMWLETRAIGVCPQDAKALWGKPEDVVLMDHRRELVFVNAIAVAGLIDDPQARDGWLRYVRELIAKYKRDQALREGLRNN